ncbi:MAG TPA: S9 family peptidase [Bryobacteraceae bacterium]|nr:S9 family peptidase [Bryobacteraceae bacterium]
MRKLALAVLFTAAAFAAKTPFTTTDLFEFRNVGDPEISRDGKSVIYTITRADKMNDAFYSNLWIADADGKGSRPLTQGNFRDSSPRWSPDGSRLAYISNRSGKPQIYVRWMDSGQEAMITDLEQAPSGIVWSPDGNSIAYTARVPAKPDFSVKLPERPNGAKWADPPIVVTKLRWRADGSGLIRPGYTHIFVVPATGGTPRQITSGDYNHGGGGAGGGGFSWTPDGKWILTSAQRIPDADYSLEGPDLYAFSVADGTVKQLTNRKGPDTSPEASPDGTKIAYIGHDWKFQSYTVNHLYLMDADGGNQKLVTANLDRDVRSPRWSADSKTIYFLADDHGRAQIYAASLDGKVKKLTDGAYRLGSAYAGNEPITVSANGRIATTKSSPTEDPDVVVLWANNPATMRRVTEVNDSLMASRKLGTVEEITYDSFDGKPIQGWIVKPPDFDATKKYPLLLDIHGGPHAMYGVEFSHEYQVQAARGFVVLYTNPRGSTGYGEEFGNIIHTKYPGDDYTDLMKGVDAVIAKGYIDPKKLCVTGGSGGGLLTAWIIGHTDRFAAAVSQYPVTDWITQAGTADGGYTHAALWMKSFWWDNPQQFIEHSPVFFAKNFKTPTMVLTGEADLRTPIAQSEELYFALKAQKIPSVLVRIPDEPHGIRGTHPSHRVDKMEYVIGWMEKWVKSAD